MLKYILRGKKKLIISILGILLICSIAIAIGIYAQIIKPKRADTNISDENEKVKEELKNNFNNIFNNSVDTSNSKKSLDSNINYNDIIYLAYDIDETKEGQYSVKASIPMFKLETDITKQINKDINDIFISKILNIISKSNNYTVYNMDYICYINEEILSLAIKCTLKDSNNPQRVIIQTYNYDIKNDKLLSLEDLIVRKNLNSNDVQNTIYSQIQSISEKMETLSTEGYNLYKRTPESDIYKIKNTLTFFLGKDGYLYIVYAYGNNGYTSELDLIII